jgi:1-acyl-sn-glycerol-3-phosphate acyltransferase
MMRAGWLRFAYYFSWVLFGLGGFAINLAYAPLLLLGDREKIGRHARRGMRWMLDLWLRWMGFSGIVRVTWRGFEGPLPGGVVYIANHPTLVDAPFLLARLPDAVCILKPSLMRNPLIGPAAHLCGYVSGDKGVDLIRDAAHRVSEGQSLLIFPEGTRTLSDGELHPLRPGFALIAQLAKAPVRIIRVRSSPHMARKDWPWWKLPPVPGWFEFTLEEVIPADRLGPPGALTRQARDWLSVPPAAHILPRLPPPLTPILTARLRTFWLAKPLGVSVGMSTFFFVYFAILNHPRFPVFTMPLTALDRWVSFSPSALFLYVSLWIYVPLLPALLDKPRDLLRYTVAAFAMAVFGLGCFFVWPTAAPAPGIEWTQYPAMAFLKSVDASGNACPSLHVAFAVFTTAGFQRLLRGIRAGSLLLTLNLFWGAGITYSTMATKQHVALDVLAGTFLGLLVAAVTFKKGFSAERSGKEPESSGGITPRETA